MLVSKPLPDFAALNSQLEAHLAAKPAAAVLNSSRTQNLPTSKEEIASLSCKIVDIVVSNTHKDVSSYGHLLENRENLAVLAANAFKCLYISSGNNTPDLLTVTKQHHGFVIRLIAWKDLENALVQLGLLRKALLRLLKLPVSSDTKSGPIPSMELYEGIPYSNTGGQSTAAANLVVAYYFLVLQSTLQHITARLPLMACDDNLAAGMGLFDATASMLSPSHSFGLWLDSLHATNKSSRTKNLNNMKKMASGYAKTLQYMDSKTPSLKLKTYKSLFLLKVAEYDLLLSGTTPVDFHGIEMNPITEPFILDLKLVLSSIEASSSTARIEEALVALTAPPEKFNSTTLVLQQALIQTIDNLANTPTPALLDTFNEALLHSTASAGLITNKVFLSSLKSLCIHILRKGDYAAPIVQTIMAYFESTLKTASGLSKDHLLILDPITIFIKDSISGTDLSTSGFIKRTITQIFEVLCRFRQFKRIRNLSNLLYNLGSKSLSVDNWRSSLSYESFIYNYNAATRTDENLNAYKSKVEKIANALYELNFFTESMSFISHFLADAFQHAKSDSTFFSLLKAFDMPLIIQLLVKCLATDGSYLINIFGCDSKLNDATKAILFVKVLRFLEKSNNVEQKTGLVNHLIQALYVESAEMRVLCVYAYHNMNGLSQKLEVACMAEPTLASPMVSLFLAGIGILKVVESSEGCDRDLVTAMGTLEKYILIQEADISYQEYEFEITKYFIKYLKFAGLHGHAIHIIRTYKEHRSQESQEFALFNYLLDMDLCDCSIRLGLSADSALTLTSAGKILKQLSSVVVKGDKLKLVTSEMIMTWKLYQLRHLVLVGDDRQISEKSLAILKFLDSKPEFDLKALTSSSNYLDKFNNLLVIAKVQFLSGTLNFQRGSFHEAIKNLKLAIKLLFSVIKRLGNNVPKSAFYDIKWSSADLLFSSYASAIDIFKHLGMSSEALFYINELRKLNESNRAMLTSASNSYLISNHLSLSNDLEDGLLELNKAMNMSSNFYKPALRFTELFSRLLLAVSKSGPIDVDSVEMGRVEMLELSKGRKIPKSYMDLDNTELASLFTARDFGIDVLQLEHALTFCDVPFQSHVNEYGLNEAHGTISKALLDVKTTINDMKKKLAAIPLFNLLPESPQALPMFSGLLQNQSPREYADYKEEIISVSNSLVQCKDILLKISSEENFSVLDVHEMHDTNKVILRCVSLLSAIAIFKEDSTDSLLLQTYNLQDIPRLLPFFNSRLIHEKKDSDPPLSANELLPAPILGVRDAIGILSSNLVEALKKELPANWSVISIDICPYSNDLLLSKVNSTTHRTPFFLRLPLQRSNGRGGSMTDDCLSFQSLRELFKDIIDQSNLSTKSSTTSEIKTKEDRRKWWKLRFLLDLKLKQLLECVEHRWIAGFQSFFSDSFYNDELFDDFKQDFNRIWHNLLLFGRKKLEKNSAFHLSDLVIRLFYDFDSSDDISMKEHDDSALDDLIYFVLDQFMFHGGGNSYDDFNVELCRDLLHRLIQNYSSTRENLARAVNVDEADKHLAIIPGTSCAFFPWESLSFLRGKSISRMPSVHSLLELLQKRKNRFSVSIEDNGGLFYMINPSGDLVRTENRFQPLFESIVSEKKSGIVAKRPSEEYFLSELLKSEVFVYLGHGGCEQYVKSSTLFKAILSETKGSLPPSLLIGCSSGALQLNGYLEPNGNIYNWLICGSPMVVANLWDVTDKDIDLFSLSLLQKWGMLPGCKTDNVNVCQAVSKSRGECTLKYLNGSAPIIYGLPLRLK